MISPFRAAMRSSVIGLLLAAALAACADSKQAPPPGMPVTEVGVVTLQPQSVTLTRELPGRTSPYLVAEVRPQVSGIVKQRTFTEGGLVRAGQVLYQLDDATYRADVLSAKAQLARAEATLNSARLTARRSVDLAAIDAVSRQDNENAAAALSQAEADFAAAQAALARSEVILAYARITSPISGRIGRSSVTQGALVTANQTQVLATVQQLDPIYVDLAQSSNELLELRRQTSAGRARAANLPVTIVLEDGTRFDQAGKLAFSDITVDQGTGSFLLRVVVPNPKQLLLPGMYVRAVVGNAVREHALLVPQRGVMRDPKGNTAAMVLGPDGTVQARPVKVSSTIGDQWLVEDGLAAGDQVIVEGLQKIQPGMPARVAAPKPAAEVPAAAKQ